MVYNLVIYSIVYTEITEALTYYESIYIRLGLKFESAIQKALDQLEVHPYNYYNLEDGKHRRIVIDGFPYAFVYTISGNDVIVKMLFSQIQDPARLWKRLNQ